MDDPWARLVPEFPIGIFRSQSLFKDVGRVERAWGAGRSTFGVTVCLGLSLALAAVSTATGPPGARLGHGAWGTS